jgi:hypothetical protein
MLAAVAAWNLLQAKNQPRPIRSVTIVNRIQQACQITKQQSTLQWQSGSTPELRPSTGQPAQVGSSEAVMMIKQGH